MKTLIWSMKHLVAHSRLNHGRGRAAICAYLCLFTAGAAPTLPPRNVQPAEIAREEPKTVAQASNNQNDTRQESSDPTQETRNNNESGDAQEATVDYYSSRPAVISLNDGSRAQQALLVFSSNPEPKVRSQLQEDLAVMHHLLDKSLESTLSRDLRTRNALGVDLFFSPDSAHLNTAYFEGYGAFFLLRVDTPLLPPNKEQPTSDDSQPRNSAWEEARQEVFGQPSVEGGGTLAATSEPYNDEKVKRLKSSVLEALKNAANIRALKGDEGVSVCVIGSPKQSSTTSPVARRQMGRMGQSMAVYTRSNAGSEQRATILTVRVKKGDIDAFASGKMTLEEFRQHAAVSTYEGEPQTGMGFGTFGSFSVGGSGGGYGTSYNFKK